MENEYLKDFLPYSINRRVNVACIRQEGSDVAMVNWKGRQEKE
jgi:hypothetical protein